MLDHLRDATPARLVAVRVHSPEDSILAGRRPHGGAPGGYMYVRRWVMTDDSGGRRRVALVCSQFTMQSAFALLILALNSARLGYETLIYFTFEGLKMIRPGYLEKLQYIPTGPEQTEHDVEVLTEELRAAMDAKDIPYVEDMLAMAQLEGVRLLACKTSADLFDLRQEDFIDGVEIMVAETFMKHAAGSDMHMQF
jgi:peroxiredoxin family protein